MGKKKKETKKGNTGGLALSEAGGRSSFCYT